jgi:tRNA pseudouridine38-40 synthase
VRRIALRVAYDGTDFAGWQVQRDERTVQGVLEASLSEVCKERINLVASGRTDSGVHARGQVCHFDAADTGPPGEKFSRALNRVLPPDVRVMDSAAVGDAFHARYAARMREYRYYLLEGRCADPFERPYCYLRASLPPVELLNRFASPLVGTHDFTSFAAEKDENESKHRSIASCAFYPEGPYTVLRILGNSFLWKMVRTIVGTILELGGSGATPRDLENILHARDRKAAGATAPARGLFLYRVYYDEKPFT